MTVPPMDDSEWRTVSRRRGGPTTDRKCRVVRGAEFAFSCSKHTTGGSSAGIDKDGAVGFDQQGRAEAVALAIELLAEEIQVSALWEEVQCSLKNAVYGELVSMHSKDNSLSSLNLAYKETAIASPPPASSASDDDFWGVLCDTVSFSLVCLGLGSPTDCSDVLSCRYQLALGFQLQKLLQIPGRRMRVQDPVMNETDALVLQALFSDAHAEEEVKAQEERNLGLFNSSPECELTVYLAPHCDADLYGDLLGLELGLQPFCLRCFSCSSPSSSSRSHNDADAKGGGFSLVRDTSCHPQEKSHGFVLIANVLSSYELRTSFFGELTFVEHPRTDNFPQICSFPIDEGDENEECPDAPAWKIAPKNFGGSLSAAQQKQEKQVVYSPSVCCSSDPTTETKEKTKVSQCHQVANEHHVAGCPYTSRRSGGTSADEDDDERSNESPKFCRNSINKEAQEFCRFVTTSRGALLLLELLPYVDEWPLKSEFRAYPRAFNDLSISRFPTPRTNIQRCAFWRSAIQRQQHEVPHSRAKKTQRTCKGIETKR